MKSKFFLLTVLGSISVVSAFSQGENVKGNPFKTTADSLAAKKNFQLAAEYYVKEFNNRVMVPYKKAALLNAAYNYLRVEKPDTAFILLELAEEKYGFINPGLLKDVALFLKYQDLPPYKKLLSNFEEKIRAKKNPETAPIHTSDIDLFWKVYDRFLADSSQAADLFLADYFEKGTDGLQEYYRIKTPSIGGINGFARNMKTMTKFYAGIRSNTLKAKNLKDTIRVIYRNLSKWYPDAIFPSLNMHIGGWSSGGTATEYGLHIGVDMYSNDETTDKSELDPWQKRNSYLLANLRYVVAHELIHAQQDKMRADTTLLKYAIKEGMADFIGELISGKTANEALHDWVENGNEKRVWEAFKNDMYYNRYSLWIGNSNQEKPDWPADLGYWVGYKICKEYFIESKDKKQAIYDMLHLSDYKGFLEKSRVEEKINIK